MHRSQLGGLIIDCEDGDLDVAVEFWSQALGIGVKPQTDPDDENYWSLENGPNAPYIEVQKVDHPSRVHLDIETDDIDAEVRRLEALGAKKLEKIRTWIVMEAPTGQRFCVVRAQSRDFVNTAKAW